ncbi:MAG: nitrous oxide reductase accessory protein NosL [Gammaproteobacteria bacterium]|nr:nitrous oxide reductase accessory protein NosL [Gammaproteobacteria bacterium]
MKSAYTSFLRSVLPAVVLAAASLPVWAGGPPPGNSKELPCPVCGMLSSNYPKWRTRIFFKGGAISSFDSPTDMFLFLGDMARYDSKHTEADVTQIHVTDYVQRRWIEARRAFYVSGSTAKGPMGDDLPAFENKADAGFFARSAGGKVLNFAQAAKQISGTQAK